MATWFVPIGFFLVLAGRTAFAQSAQLKPPEQTQRAAPKLTPSTCDACAPVRPQVVEVTFGSAQLFAQQYLLLSNGEPKQEVVPVTSALLMIEWLMRERVSILGLFNLPLATKKIIVDGAIREEFNSPSTAIGVRVSPLRLEVFSQSHFELQLAALGGLTLPGQGQTSLFPMVAARLHFANRAGFALYLGGAFAFRNDTLALLYGIGHRF